MYYIEDKVTKEIICYAKSYIEIDKKRDELIANQNNKYNNFVLIIGYSIKLIKTLQQAK